MPDTGRSIRAGATVAAVARQYDVATSLIYGSVANRDFGHDATLSRQ
ncbi:hypothetical protein ACFSQQ_38800 [Mesorhizobium kowhaii]